LWLASLSLDSSSASGLRRAASIIEGQILNRATRLDVDESSVSLVVTCRRCSTRIRIGQIDGDRVEEPRPVLRGVQSRPRSILEAKEGAAPDTLPSQAGPPTVKVSPTVRVNIAKAKITGLRETQQTVEEVGVDEETYSNRSSPATTEHVFSITHTVDRSVVIEEAASRLMGTGGQATIIGLAQIYGKIESTLERRYSLSERATLEVTSSVKIHVPAGKAVRARVKWFKVFQSGEVDLLAPDGSTTVLIPYRVPVRLKFNTETIDL
jgi:hypothetical protein